MKRFALHIGGLILATAICLSLFDLGYTKILEASRPRSKFQLLRGLKGKQIDLAFLGSSRVENSVVASMVEQRTGKSCVNLGFQASSLTDIYTVLKALEAYDIKAKKLYIQVDFNYNYLTHSDMLKHEIAPFIRETEVNRTHFDFAPDRHALFYFPFYRYGKFGHEIGLREIAMSLVRKKSILAGTRGYVPLYGKQTTKHYSLPESIAKHNAVMDSITGFAKSNGMAIEFFVAPINPKAKNKAFISALSRKVPGLLNYSGALHGDMYFYDDFHLNDRGAAVFTEQFIKRELK